MARTVPHTGAQVCRQLLLKRMFYKLPVEPDQPQREVAVSPALSPRNEASRSSPLKTLTYFILSLQTRFLAARQRWHRWRVTSPSRAIM